jgi:serine O-acetyltransferase
MNLRPRPSKLYETLLADAKLAAAQRRERHEFRSRLDAVRQIVRLLFETDAFLALAAYRVKVALRARGIPVLPRLAHRVAVRSAGISIDDEVVVQPGVVIPHGQVVIYGRSEIRAFSTLQPWVTIGPIEGETAGPTIGLGAVIGTGAKVLGEIEVGTGARVGTNAVVLDDVPSGTTVVGIPAESISD